MYQYVRMYMYICTYISTYVYTYVQTYVYVYQTCSVAQFCENFVTHFNGYDSLLNRRPEEAYHVDLLLLLDHIADAIATSSVCGRRAEQ